MLTGSRDLSRIMIVRAVESRMASFGVRFLVGATPQCCVDEDCGIGV